MRSHHFYQANKSAFNLHRKMFKALHETGENPFGLSDNFNPLKAVHDLFPEHAQLHLGQTIANTAMNTEAK